MRIEVLQWVLKVLQWTRWLRWRTFLARFPGHWFPKNDMHHVTCGFWRCFWVLKGRPARRLRLSPRWSWTTRREIVLPSALEAMDGYGWLWMAMDGYGWLWQFGLAGGPCSDANSYRSLGYQFVMICSVLQRDRCPMHIKSPNGSKRYMAMSPNSQNPGILNST